jgi:hypothetical protein
MASTPNSRRKLLSLNVGEKIMISRQRAMASVTDTGKKILRAGGEAHARCTLDRNDIYILIGLAGHLGYAVRRR